MKKRFEVFGLKFAVAAFAMGLASCQPIYAAPTLPGFTLSGTGNANGNSITNLAGITDTGGNSAIFDSGQAVGMDVFSEVITLLGTNGVILQGGIDGTGPIALYGQTYSPLSTNDTDNGNIINVGKMTEKFATAAQGVKADGAVQEWNSGSVTISSTGGDINLNAGFGSGWLNMTGGGDFSGRLKVNLDPAGGDYVGNRDYNDTRYILQSTGVSATITNAFGGVTNVLTFSSSGQLTGNTTL